MVKLGSIRQKEYEQRQKGTDKEAYLKKGREQKRKQRAAIKAKKQKYETYKAKDRMRKRVVATPSSSSPLNSSHTTRPALGKAVSHTSKSPFKKTQIISHLVSYLSPNSKGQVFASSRRRIGTCLGWPSVSTEKRDTVKSFPERPDISYCKPGRRDTIYCGKNQQGEKEYKSKHYLLWSFKEIVQMFNAEHDFEISYHTVQQFVSTEKYFLTANETPDDDWRCEKWENSELLLMAIKASLSKANNHNLASMISDDAVDFVSSVVCSVKEYDCCNDSCQNCHGKPMLEEIIQFF